MTPIPTSAAGIAMPLSFSERTTGYSRIHRLLALLLVGVMLIFTVSAVNQTAFHFKASHDQQEILQLIPSVSPSDALITDGFMGLSFAGYFFVYLIYRLELHTLALACVLKESLFIPSSLRNPFYVFTSIHAP
jgi:hypothetical protein